LSLGDDAAAIPDVPTVLQTPDWVNVWGLCAVTMTTAGWLLAGVGLARWPAILLSALGLLVVVLGVFASQWNGPATCHEHKGRDSSWLLLGGTMSLVILASALFAPQWLNSRWEMDFAVAAPNADQLLLVSLEGETTVKKLRDSDWADADQGAIQQGDVRVRIEWARVTAASSKDGASPSLLIGVSIVNAGFLRRIPYEGANSAAHVCRLRDNAGNEYRPQRSPRAIITMLQPTQTVEDVLAFEPPPPSVPYLELELPAAAWGTEGTCRFRIPRKMIAFAPVGPTRNEARR